MNKLILCLAFIALVASKPTIPELYKQNNGYFTSDYSVTYNNAIKSGEFGVCSEAGDINNDGISDVIVANPANDNDKGIVYVIYGRKGTMRQFNTMNDFLPSDGFIIKGNVAGQKLGFAVNPAGDVNGDGIDDIIIGSGFWNQQTGVSYVLYGRRSSSEFPSIVDVDRLSPSQGFRIFGSSTQGFAGYTACGAGDVNGDGLQDVIIGAFGVGSAYVVYGSRQAVTDMTLPPAQGRGFTVQGSVSEHFGNTVSKAGDFNGDGVDDLVIGAHVADGWAGRAYIVYGRREGFPASIRASEGMTIYGARGGDNFGCTVSNVGDFNGDGLQDVIIGAYAANGGRGGAYVIMGSRQNPSSFSVSSLESSTARGFSVTSSAFSQLGMYVSGGRDINGDGKSDILIGAPGWNKENGGAYVIYGYKPTSILTNIWLDIPLQAHQGFALFGTQEGSRYGQYAKMLKDINGDGVDDFIIGALNANGNKGAANLFYLPWKCMDKCSQCSKPDTCDSCASGLVWVNNDCISCPPNTHTLVNGVCKLRCSANCQQCSRADTCDICASGYGFLNGVCSICPSSTHILSGGFCVGKCSQNCAYCSRPNSCDACSPGYGLLNNFCVSCPSTHYLSNGVCQERAPQNCIQWSSPDSCQVCAAGFGLLNRVCVSCPDTHTLINGVCQERRPQNCVQWTNPEFCDICAPGFGFLGGECVSCPEGTHVLSNGSCKVKCSANCAQCSKPNMCDACAEGFGFLNSACVVCPAKTHFLSNGFCLEDKDALKQIKDFFGGLFR